MSQQIIKQPNGKYAVFSSIVDDFVALNCEPQDIIDMWLEEEKQRIEEMVARNIRRLNDPSAGLRFAQSAGLRFAQLSWEEALRARELTHGREEGFKEDPLEVENKTT